MNSSAMAKLLWGPVYTVLQERERPWSYYEWFYLWWGLSFAMYFSHA